MDKATERKKKRKEKVTKEKRNKIGSKKSRRK
jgi:hypothetical protein